MATREDTLTKMQRKTIRNQAFGTFPPRNHNGRMLLGASWFPKYIFRNAWAPYHASPPLPPKFNVEGHGYVEIVFEKMGDFYAEVGARVASLSLNIELGGDGGPWLQSNHDGRFL